MKKKKKINYKKEYVKVARYLIKLVSDMKDSYNYNLGMEIERRRGGNDVGVQICEARKTTLSSFIPELDRLLREMFDIIENRGEYDE